jgi:hypothetical protein
VQIVNPDGMVLAVATITGISKHDDRYALEGELLRGDARVGRITSTPPVAELRGLLLTAQTGWPAWAGLRPRTDCG